MEGRKFEVEESFFVNLSGPFKTLKSSRTGRYALAESLVPLSMARQVGALHTSLRSFFNEATIGERTITFLEYNLQLTVFRFQNSLGDQNTSVIIYVKDKSLLTGQRVKIRVKITEVTSDHDVLR